MREENLLTYLKETCCGRQRTVKSSELERALTLGGTDLRKRVNRLRRKGIPIGSSRDGYFYAKTAGEVYATIRQLQVMEQGLRAAIQGLESALDKFGEGSGGGGP